MILLGWETRVCGPSWVLFCWSELWEFGLKKLKGPLQPGHATCCTCPAVATASIISLGCCILFLVRVGMEARSVVRVVVRFATPPVLALNDRRVFSVLLLFPLPSFWMLAATCWWLCHHLPRPKTSQLLLLLPYLWTLCKFSPVH